MNEYDIIIIGTGPAGLSAAITSTIRNKKILLFGDDHSSQKVCKAHVINNYLGLPSILGEDLAKAFLDHLKKFDIEIKNERVAKIYQVGEKFAVQVGQEMITTKTVILATGVVMSKPFPGEDELLGKGVSYCATCDAALYKNKEAIVVSYSPEFEHEVDFLAEYADHVVYMPIYKYDSIDFNRENISIVNEKPVSILSLDEASKEEGIDPELLEVKVDPNASPFAPKLDPVFLKTNEGIHRTDGVFILRSAISPGKLIDGLKTVGPHVEVSRRMQTNIPGIFACGDIAGEPYQYIKGAGEGNSAAISAAEYIDKLTHKHED